MSSLFTTLLNTAGAIQVFNRALNVVQNNVANANTPGYARQTQTLEAASFNTATGAGGGVAAGPIQSSRDEFAEQAVRDQQQTLGQWQQKAGDLGSITTLFSLSSTTGISSSLNNFFNSFSELSVNPSDTASRQAVLDSANALAQSFNETAQGLQSVTANVQQQTIDTVANINQITADVAGLNQQIQGNFQSAADPSVDTKMHTDLEQLSQLVNFAVLKQPDGTFNLYLGGQVPLVMGNTQFQIQANFATPQTAILDAQGNDVTAHIQQGQLGALIDENNNIVPSYVNDLNTLAQGVADQVNNTLAGGLDQNGSTPTINLFSYNNTTAGPASTLSVTTGMTTGQIAAASASAPGGNGNALAVAGLANAPAINGATFTQFYGDLSARIGHDDAVANDNQTTQQSMLTQAQNQRQQVEGVSLDEQAAELVQFQAAYQAAGKMLSVVNQLTQTLMDIIH